MTAQWHTIQGRSPPLGVSQAYPSLSAGEVSFVVDIHYNGDMLRLPANHPHSDEDLLEEQPMARGLSGFLAEVHPDQMRSWVNNERCHIQLVFEL